MSQLSLIKNLIKEIVCTASLSLLSLAVFGSAAQALSLYEFTGDNAQINFDLFDNGNNSITLTAKISGDTINGDISAFGFSLDPKLFSNLVISNFTTSSAGTFTSNLLQGSSAKCSQFFGGGGQPCTENFIVNFGRGAAGGLLQDFSLTISGVGLNLDAFTNQSFAAKIQSTGVNLNGSSKLRCYYPGYMGTTSDSFSCSADNIPNGAVPMN